MATADHSIGKFEHRPKKTGLAWRCVLDFRKFLSVLMAVVGAVCSQQACAEVVADWGTVTSPLTSDATFSFAQYDITKSFTDQYLFSLEGSSGADYSVTFTFDACNTGCGSPNITYGIYDAKGGLVGTTNGESITLATGNYVFQVSGTGIGSGNNVDYFGSVTFSAVSAELVSPVPEPAPIVLTLFGFAFVAWAARGRINHTHGGRMLAESNASKIGLSSVMTIGGA